MRDARWQLSQSANKEKKLAEDRWCNARPGQGEPRAQEGRRVCSGLRVSQRVLRPSASLRIKALRRAAAGRRAQFISTSTTAAAAADMKVLVLVCALVGYAAARPGYLGLGLPYGLSYGVPGAVSAAGLPADTPEVAAAKSRILAIQAAEAARNAQGVPVVPASAAAPAAAAPGAGLAAYGPANIVIGPGGVPLDTPEVAAAKAAHAAAQAQAAAAAAAAPAAPAAPAVYAPGLLGLGLGVAGAAQVAPDGTLLTAQGVPLDTPAVAAGKIADAVAHLQAKAALFG
ncbi:cuticle protein 18.7-like [Schistocerca gregaria]|uniref:cuticle protein 18.7-like n=1 Tax=Schistocerca gregaria TaxID=7010 RepID=UPI00211DC1BC|nr:cuticle protein 18.7-like [Schistocerca gregaria]